MPSRKAHFTIEQWSTVILWAAGIGFAFNVDFRVTTLGIVLWCSAGGMFLWAAFDHSLWLRNLLRRVFRRPPEPPPARFRVEDWHKLYDRCVDITDQLRVSVRVKRGEDLPSHTDIVIGWNRSLML